MIQKNGLDLWKIVPPTYLLNIRDECNMQMLKRFTDAYEKYYPKHLKDKSGAQTDNELQEAKTKLKRLFFNSNVSHLSFSSKSYCLSRLPSNRLFWMMRLITFGL